MRQLCDVWNCMQLNKENSKKKKEKKENIEFRFHQLSPLCTMYYIARIDHTSPPLEIQSSRIAERHPVRNYNDVIYRSFASKF